MEINGPGSVQGPDPIRPDRTSPSRFSKAVNESAPDSAEISEIAKLKAMLRDVPDIRIDRIERIRAEIEAGTYETPEKIRSVIERLLEEL